MQYLTRGILVIITVAAFVAGYLVAGRCLEASVPEVRASEVHLDGPELATIAHNLDENVIAIEVAQRLKSQAWSERFRLIGARVAFCGYDSITLYSDGHATFTSKDPATPVLSRRDVGDWMVNE